MKSQRIANIYKKGVSIIISPTNNYQYLKRLLKTFSDNNSHHPVELIIDVSYPSEQTYEVIDQLKLKYFIMPLQCTDKSMYVFFNQAAEEAVYPNLLFLNSSIIYTNNILPSAIKKLNNPLVGLVGIRFNEFNTIAPDENKIIYEGITVRWNKLTEQFEPVLVNRKHLPAEEYYKNKNYLGVNSSFLLCRKKDYLQVGGFNENLNPDLVDLEFCLRLQTELKKVCHCLNEKCLHLPSSILPENVHQKKSSGIDQIQTKSPQLQKNQKEVNTKNSLSCKIAVIAHIYYFEQWPFLANHMKNIPTDYQLFVTMPENSNLVNQKSVVEDCPGAEIILYPNKGRDIAPFLEALLSIAEENYALVCKVHTKKDDSFYGDSWRQLMLQSTLGSENLVRLILNKFTENPDLGMVGPLQLYKSARSLMYDNLNNINNIRKLIPKPYPLPPDWGFFTGSCFWVRPNLLVPLAKVARQLTYENDNTRRDGQLAHALERLFGLEIMEAEQNIGLVTSPAIRHNKSEVIIVKPPGNPSSEYVEQTIPFYIRQHLAGKNTEA